MRCCCVQVCKKTIAPQNYVLHSIIVIVIVSTVSILEIRLKVDSYNALINKSSMGIILSGQTIN